MNTIVLAPTLDIDKYRLRVTGTDRCTMYKYYITCTYTRYRQIHTDTDRYPRYEYYITYTYTRYRHIQDRDRYITYQY